MKRLLVGLLFVAGCGLNPPATPTIVNEERFEAVSTQLTANHSFRLMVIRDKKTGREFLVTGPGYVCEIRND